MLISALFCLHLPILFITIFCNAAKFNSVLKDDETTKNLSEKDDEKKKTENFTPAKKDATILNKESSKIPFFTKTLFFLPSFCFVFNLMLFRICCDTINNNDVKRTYSEPYGLYLSFDHLIYLRSKATTINPCNGSDSNAFQSFVTLWKERNEAQIKLDKWIETNAGTENNDAFSIPIKNIEAMKKEVKALNATLEPKFREYKNCFLANNASKRSSINYFCFGSLILFNVGLMLCTSVALNRARYSFITYPLTKYDYTWIKIALHYQHIAYIIVSCYTSFFYYDNAMNSIPEEFLI